MGDAENRQDQALREAGGRFRRGASGNPSGRPRGSRNRVSRVGMDLLSANSSEILEALIEQAKKGEPTAMRLCVERIIPRRSAHLVEVDDLPRLRKAEDLAAAAARVVELAAAGEMALDEARQFLALLREHRAAIETTELVVRLEALEREGKL